MLFLVFDAVVLTFDVATKQYAFAALVGVAALVTAFYTGARYELERMSHILYTSENIAAWAERKAKSC